MNENLNFNNIKNNSNVSVTFSLSYFVSVVEDVVQSCFLTANSKITNDFKDGFDVISIISNDGKLEYEFIIYSLTEIHANIYGHLLYLGLDFYKFLQKYNVTITFECKNNDETIPQLILRNNSISYPQNFISLTSEILNKIKLIHFGEYVITGVRFTSIDEYLQLTTHFNMINMTKHDLSVYGDPIYVYDKKTGETITGLDNRLRFNDINNVSVTWLNDTKQFRIYNNSTPDLIEESFNFNDISDNTQTVAGALLDDCVNYESLPEDPKMYQFVVDVAMKFKNLYEKWYHQETQWEYNSTIAAEKNKHKKWILIWDKQCKKQLAILMFNDGKDKKPYLYQISICLDDFPCEWQNNRCFYKYEFMKDLYELLNPYFGYTRLITAHYSQNATSDFWIGLDFENTKDLSNIKKVLHFIMISVPFEYFKNRFYITNFEQFSDDELKIIANEATNYCETLYVDNTFESPVFSKIAQISASVNPSWDPLKDRGHIYIKYKPQAEKKFQEFLKKNNIVDPNIMCEPSFFIHKNQNGWLFETYVVGYTFYFIVQEKTKKQYILKVFKEVQNLRQKEFENTKWQTNFEEYI